MAKKKAKNKTHVAATAVPHVSRVAQAQTSSQEQADELFDLSDPDEFRKAFIAAEILNRKY